MSLEILFESPGGVGYAPVFHMAQLAAELLDGRLIVLAPEPISRTRQMQALLPSRRGKGAALLICAYPTALLSLLQIPGWRRRYDRVAAWVFDSFWIEHIPRIFQRTCHFDHVFLTENEDCDVWSKRLRTDAEWLPWGSDALRLGSCVGDRPVDVLRVGRQPIEWDSDAQNAISCARAGMQFEGRPAVHQDPTANHRLLMSAFARTKFSLSFSNIVSPEKNTHPTKQYITGRWTDALAAGASVAGVPPETDSVDQLLWTEALLNLGSTDLEEGLRILRPAVACWTPERARINHLRSLQRLDWRHRFLRIANTLELGAPALHLELVKLEQRVASLSPSL